ncbi:MAG: endonuclease/exonuclease/phosphatase family protein [Burkholderiaceae bacterium]
MKQDPQTLRVATWNIHKGVRGMGPNRRLEIHDMVHAVEQFDADIICLQEVRRVNHKEAGYFTRWPELPQADYLAPEGYEAVYRTNAHTRHGEHGNALLSRWPVINHQHEDMSDHRFEQRGLLHIEVLVHGAPVHVIVVHLGLIAASRTRQLAQLAKFMEREIPKSATLVVAGDFNSPVAPVRWAQTAMKSRANAKPHTPERTPTFPSRLPLVQLDHVFARHAKPTASHVPRGAIWSRMSDHLPLIVDFTL